MVQSNTKRNFKQEFKEEHWTAEDIENVWENLTPDAKSLAIPFIEANIIVLVEIREPYKPQYDEDGDFHYRNVAILNIPGFESVFEPCGVICNVCRRSFDETVKEHYLRHHFS